ncbi:MAG: hypothetical protein IJH78_03160 [Clostridia bacterium]|nr:hypothetical protein [Clostridia bacterium]
MREKFIEVGLRLPSGEIITIYPSEDDTPDDILFWLSRTESFGLPDARRGRLVARHGRQLDAGISLAENDVLSGDILRVSLADRRRRTVTYLYGCPAADDLAGVVPPAMLTRDDPPRPVSL